MIKYAYYRVLNENIEKRNLKYFVFFKNENLENLKFVKSLYMSKVSYEDSHQIEEIYSNEILFKINNLDIKNNDISIEEILKNYLETYIFNNKKIDYSFILIKPSIVWTIIKKFKDILEEKILSNTTKDLYFYSFSPQGKTLLLLLLYFFKNDYPNRKIFINKVKKSNMEGDNIFLDITLNTGATAEIGLKMRNVIKDKEEMLNNINFLIVKNNSNNLKSDKIYSLLS